MPPRLVLFIGAIFIWFAFRSDRNRDSGSMKGLFWPSLWYLVVASRMVGIWFSIWGVPMFGGGSGGAEEGSPIDRYFFALLTVIGFWILHRRRFNWGEAFRLNPWITALILYMAVSIFWSDYPFVSFKRYIKVLGSIVMALVVLTNDRPLDSMLTVLRRCLYVHLPMSIICVRYFRPIGVSFDWSGTSLNWTGISSSKNTLGQVAMIGAVYFTWEVWRHWRELKWRNLHCLYLLMALYLLKGSDHAMSLTSVSVTVFALVIFFRLQSLRSRVSTARQLTLSIYVGMSTLVTLIIAHSIFMFSENSIFGFLVTKFGRDITLTDRTYIWHDVYAAASGNPLLGVGFGGFWIGRIANIPWNANMTWELGQAHSGYIDTYLQLGLIGTFLMVGMLISTLSRLQRALDKDFDFGCFRITMLVTILFVNVTETSFLRGDHHLWFVMLLCLWFIPATAMISSEEEAISIRS